MIGETAKHDAPRQPNDGPVEIRRAEDRDGNWFLVHVDKEVFIVSEYNARRLLAMLSMMLDLPLTKAAQKVIKL